MGNVDGVFAVNPDEPEGLEQRCYVTNRPDIDERRSRAQADFGFPTPDTSYGSSTRCSLREM